MFTGIIEEIGQIQAVKHGSASSRLTIQAAKILSDVQDGDSIAVNGVCLTVTSHGSGYFYGSTSCMKACAAPLSVTSAREAA